jgi:hypothetical protein
MENIMDGDGASYSSYACESIESSDSGFDGDYSESESEYFDASSEEHSSYSDYSSDGHLLISEYLTGPAMFGNILENS